MMNRIRCPLDLHAKRVSFTGYRPQKMPWAFDESDPRCVVFKIKLRAAIETLIEQGYTHFLSGGAMGMDMYAAEVVIDLRTKYPQVTLEMVSPYDGQADKWMPALRARHERLMEIADIVTCVSHEYTKGCMFKRNHYLVVNADLLLAAYDGQPGGTKMTIGIAEEMHVPVWRLAPCDTNGLRKSVDCGDSLLAQAAHA